MQLPERITAHLHFLKLKIDWVLKQMIVGVLLMGLHSPTIYAQADSSSTEPKSTAHFQFTAISQGHFPFRSPYSGMNSLAASSDWGATSLTSTLFLGRKLWKGGTVYFNPEVSGGEGLSGSLGVAGALNGETYRVDNPAPVIYIARAYVQQQIPLTNSSFVILDDDVNNVRSKVAAKRITLTAGKFAVADFLGNNAFSDDPRTQFFNWSLWATGAWDYPANTRGYDYGILAEYFSPKWAIHLTSVAVSRIANGSLMEYNFSGAHAEVFQVDRLFSIKGHPGTVRLLLSQMYSRAPTYQSGLTAIAQGNTSYLKIFEGRAEAPHYGGKKFTVGINADQELSKSTGVFLRLGWNDGKHATWAFTEIDHSLSGGVSLKGKGWKRPGDVLGAAIALNGISKVHRTFLEDGGNGFMLGDGRLNYGMEQIMEVYYATPLTKFFTLTVDYQMVNHPGYNKDRGPVHVLGFRGHVFF